MGSLGALGAGVGGGWALLPAAVDPPGPGGHLALSGPPSGLASSDMTAGFVVEPGSAEEPTIDATLLHSLGPNLRCKYTYIDSNSLLRLPRMHIGIATGVTIVVGKNQVSERYSR